MQGRHSCRSAARDAARQCALARACLPAYPQQALGRRSGGAACRPPWRRSRLCGGAGRPLRPRVLRRPLRPCILRGPLRLRGSLHAAPAHKSHAIAQSRCKAEGCRGVAALDQRARTCLKLYQQGTPKAEASHMELAGVISKQLITNSSGNLCTCAWGCAFELH